MNVKKAIPLAAALILGLVSARMVVHMIQNKGPAAAAGPRLVNVVMASRDLIAGEPIADTDLRLGQIVADSAPDKTFSVTDDVVGRVVATSVGNGQAIVESLLAPKGSGIGLQAIIPKGMRAVTIDVNEMSGVAGNLAAGCHVDIVETLRDDGLNQYVSGCVAQNVEVTAVGVRPATGQEPDIQGAHSVTLLATPRQAELIELAATNGHPRLVLRGSKDQTVSEVPPVTLAELANFRRSRPAEASAPATRPASDPFASAAATTRPSGPSQSEWTMRVIDGGQPSVVNVLTPYQARPAAVTGNDNQDVDQHP